jgi:hypothetical protein
MLQPGYFLGKPLFSGPGDEKIHAPGQARQIIQVDLIASTINRNAFVFEQFSGHIVQLQGHCLGYIGIDQYFQRTFKSRSHHRHAGGRRQIYADNITPGEVAIPVHAFQPVLKMTLTPGGKPGSIIIIIQVGVLSYAPLGPDKSDPGKMGSVRASFQFKMNT